jgi:hypothetical protein
MIRHSIPPCGATGSRFAAKVASGAMKIKRENLIRERRSL